MRTILIILILISSVVLAACSSAGPDLDGFAKCLTTNGMTFYGAFWCPHCASMKEDFGDSMKYVQYVECDARGTNPQPGLCEEKGIEGFPTFIFDNGNRLSGRQPLSELAVEAGCPLPQ